MVKFGRIRGPSFSKIHVVSGNPILTLLQRTVSECQMKDTIGDECWFCVKEMHKSTSIAEVRRHKLLGNSAGQVTLKAL